MVGRLATLRRRSGGYGTTSTGRGVRRAPVPAPTRAVVRTAGRAAVAGTGCHPGGERRRAVGLAGRRDDGVRGAAPGQRRAGPVETRGAVLREAGTGYEIVDLEVVDPGPGEVLVEMAYAGLCHSDEHLRHSN